MICVIRNADLHSTCTCEKKLITTVNANHKHTSDVVHSDEVRII